MLLAGCNRHSQQGGGGVGTVNIDVIVVAGKTVGESDAVDEHIAAFLLAHPQLRQT